MNAIRPIRMPAARAVTFKAWRLRHGTEQAYPVNVDEADTLDDATHLAMIGGALLHKDRLFVREYHKGERAGVLHGFYVKEKAAIWQKDEATGAPKRVKPLALECQFSMRADSFLPARAFDALSDHATGCDLTLVDG